MSNEPLSRNLERSDIPSLASFAPEEWHIALDAVLLQHIERPYYTGRVLVKQDRIVAMGHGIATGAAGWIGAIIVHPEARRRGLGTRITNEVAALLRAAGCRNLLLIATPMGEPVYARLGFRITAEYVFLRLPRLDARPAPSIRRLQPADIPCVLALDAAATGESREPLLRAYLQSGWVSASSGAGVEGFLLPSFGSGYIAASVPRAGRELLAFKHSLYPGEAVVPAPNTDALRFLLDQGAEETTRAPRMALGDDSLWHPELIYARAGGYCG